MFEVRSHPLPWSLNMQCSASGSSSILSQAGPLGLGKRSATSTISPPSLDLPAHVLDTEHLPREMTLSGVGTGVKPCRAWIFVPNLVPAPHVPWSASNSYLPSMETCRISVRVQGHPIDQGLPHCYI